MEKQVTYSIYHIPTYKWKDGKIGKIGTSINPKRRVRSQGYSQYEILEVHTDIKVASERERELQKEYGYKVDSRSYICTTSLNNYHTEETKEKKRKVDRVGLNNSRYGTGRIYIETTSGFKGTFYDMKQKYPGWMVCMIRRKKIQKNSLYPTLNWQIFND